MSEEPLSPSHSGNVPLNSMRAQEGSILHLLERGDERLTIKAGRILDILDPEFQAFIDALIRCGQANDGVGIAAPQVGKALRVFIMAPRPNPRYPDAPEGEPMAIINPVILNLSDESEPGWEGCLSVPGYRAQVPRHKAIEVAFTDRTGRNLRGGFSGFMARLFQHEYDHLEGILYPERLAEGSALITLQEYTALTGIQIPR